MKISVIIVSYNTPNLIKPQYLLLKKYLINKFDYFVYNNSSDPGISESIKKECYDIGIKCIDIPQDIFSSNDVSFRAGKSLDYSIKHNIENFPEYSHMMILDSDMFLIKEFDMINFMGNSSMMGISQSRNLVFYYTNQLFFSDLRKLENFKNETKFLCGIVSGERTDCGGYLYEYINKYSISHSGIENNRHSGTIESSNIESIEEEFKDYFLKEIDLLGGKSFAEYFGGSFLHFRSGTNWINFEEGIHQKRNSLLLEYLNKRLENKKLENEKNY